MAKKYNPIENLKGFAHSKGAKLPSGAKIGSGTVKKTTKRKVLKMRAHLNV